MQFDSKAFKEENAEVYLSYCRPKQKEASIVIKRVKTKDNEEDKQVWVLLFVHKRQEKEEMVTFCALFHEIDVILQPKQKKQEKRQWKK